MKNSEFDIIKKYFTFADKREDVILGTGDDCACVRIPENKQLLVTTDMLNAGVHFPENTRPGDIAWKSLMVNLSDLAAMGATPAWVTLAISLPEVSDGWLREFSTQFHALLSRYNISLIGGDTTRGPLSITIQAMGLAEAGNMLRRDAAHVGDKIYVTGTIGDAAVGLQAVLDRLEDDKLLPCIERLNRPEARIAFGEELGSCASCAIDISDGLLADLGHILSASHCGAGIHLQDIPVSSCLRHYFDRYHAGSIDWSMVLTRGDDYELCFTVNSEQQDLVVALANRYQLQLSCIGEITASNELLVMDDENRPVSFTNNGFQHF